MQPQRRRLCGAALRGGLALAGLATLGAAGGCALLVPPVLPRMDTLRLPGPCPGRSDTLVVMLPGAYSRPPEFVEAGFPQALRERGLNADVLIVDSHLGYFSDRSVLRRLRDEVVLPARAQGYRRVWLVGISLGGFGALGYAVRHGSEIDGVLALAPYLGPRRLTQEIEEAGGPRAWRAAGRDTSPPDASDELDRELWRAFTHPASKLPPVHLGYGVDDRFAGAHRRFAELLPAERVRTAPGGHDWPAWRALWQAWLDQGLLADSRCAAAPAA
ncbi:alpha/beta hydrolase [Rubrivivax rivuli]|uniref:Alpha/beta hydrolase n=1 Tax=Rubrivivax rivuli TaxID=1862385 RepID=A0A437RIR3_9BURK|nr:alpha/beta hydrolase [Rubrivivax rivuli]